MEQARRSRFKVEPRGKAYQITPYKLSILSLLQRYRYLPTKYIHTFVGGNKSHFGETMTQLRHEAGLIDCRWPGGNALYQQAVWFLTRKGYAELARRGFLTDKKKTGHEFEHELMVCLIQASFELGAKEQGLQLITAQDILNHPNCPAATRQQKEPFVLHTQFDYQVKSHTFKVAKDVETDGEFFGLARPTESGRTTLMFPGFEADRRTEPLEPEDYDRPSIKQKFLAFRQLAREDAWRKKYGIPNFIIPFITINEAHMHAMMRVVENITRGHGSQLFIFKALPNFAAFDEFPPPTGYMLTEPWKRVGHPDYTIVNELQSA